MKCLSTIEDFSCSFLFSFIKIRVYLRLSLFKQNAINPEKIRLGHRSVAKSCFYFSPVYAEGKKKVDKELCQSQYLTRKPKQCSGQYVTGIEEPSNLTSVTQCEEEWANKTAEKQKDKSCEKCLGGPWPEILLCIREKVTPCSSSLFWCNAGHCSDGEKAYAMRGVALCFCKCLELSFNYLF